MRFRPTSAFGALIALAAVGCGNNVTYRGKPVPPIAIITGPGTGPAQSVVELDGTQSYDPNAVAPPGIYTWEWSLASAPAGSTATIAASNNDERFGELSTDKAGRYIVGLRVRDINDFAWSDITYYQLEIFPITGITAVLTWSTAVNDVDLHLVNETEMGSLFKAPGDCFFQNLRPDWLPAGITDGDPSLHHDEVNGFGPETLELPVPTVGTQYHLYVHYFSTDGLGPTDATIKVYENGFQVFELQHQGLAATDLWDVATLQWTVSNTVTINPVDAVSPNTTF